ncbi:hypothetical protein C922_03528 [Plasmodium inui San Antonio 1]|uniref:Protein TOC75 n=1 Tax=Plasmodium inui San Antonio 1 TaxID=1237626 RepID=W7A447_9APIC|nr:hypothetical protein C922_03528 [Plasmodium inui San Antonio 1]EUD66058.1 hypothetical protein C922_03528 [Plasmodium inui San Antonio 1]
MKNVTRLCVWLLILANWATVRGRRVCERVARDNYSGAANLSSGLFSGVSSGVSGGLSSDLPSRDKHPLSHYRPRKTNHRNLLFLKNKLKEIWDRFTTRGSHHFNKPSKEKQNSSNLKKAFRSFTPKCQNDLISRVVVRNSTVIRPIILSNLLIRENIKTIRRKDIDRVVKIVSDFYTKSNYLFSRVLRHEVVKDGDQNILIIYVEELVLDRGCVQIRVLRPARPTGKRTNTEEMAISTTTPGTAPPTPSTTTPPTATPTTATPQGELLFERKGSACNLTGAAPRPDDLQKPEAASKKLRKFFEKKMNIKEGSIFVWDQATFDLILKSNIFNYVHVKLWHDKQERKHILQIDLMENKKVSFVPSISKSFNSLLDLCINITFGYLHSIKYGDKFRVKLFKNLSYKNNKHDYDMVFVNDIVELEKLRNNSHAYFLFGVNVKQAFKKELDGAALTECINIMNRQGENGEKEGGRNVQGGFTNPGEQHPDRDDLPPRVELPRGSSTQRKNIYSYLHRGKVFLFAIRKIRDTILEIKVKAKRELFHNFLYFLEEKNENSKGPVHSGRLFRFRFLPFWRSPNDRGVLSNQLYNIYGSKLKLSSCLNVYSASWFEKAKCMKAFFNVRNKVDLVFYLNTDRKFRPTEDLGGEENTHYRGTDASKTALKSTMLSFFKQANKRGGFLSMDQIKNVYLNYTFYLQKNYRVNMFDLFCKLKRVLTFRGGRSPRQVAIQAETHPATGEEAPLVLVPLYKCKLIMNQVHLLLNVAFFFKRNLWDLRQGCNLSSIWGWGGGGEGTNGKRPWAYYHQMKELFCGNRAQSGKRDGPNFEEDLKRITLPSGDTPARSSPHSSTTYNICNVNLNDAQKEQQNEMNLTMNYKLIFPVLFETYFLNLMDLRLYLFLNWSLFGIGGGSVGSGGGNSSSDATRGSTTLEGTSNTTPNPMSEESRKSAFYNYLKLSFLKNKRKMHHSAFGFGMLLSNINIFLHFEIGRRSLLPSLVLQLDEGTSRFGYLS